MEINTIHNSDWMNNGLPDQSVDLIIADPPYFEILGDFDFIWDSFDDYLKDVEKWAIECKRVLKDNGTFFGMAMTSVSPMLKSYSISTSIYSTTWYGTKARTLWG